MALLVLRLHEIHNLFMSDMSEGSLTELLNASLNLLSLDIHLHQLRKYVKILNPSKATKFVASQSMQLDDQRLFLNSSLD